GKSMGGRGAGATLPRGTAVPRMAWLSRERTAPDVAPAPLDPLTRAPPDRTRAGAWPLADGAEGRGDCTRGTATEPPPDEPPEDELPDEDPPEDDPPLDPPPRRCAWALAVIGTARAPATMNVVRSVVSLFMVLSLEDKALYKFYDLCNSSAMPPHLPSARQHTTMRGQPPLASSGPLT